MKSAVQTSAKTGPATPLLTSGGPSRAHAPWLTATVLLVGLSGVALRWDLAIARFFEGDPCWGVVRDVLELSEFFGHGLGVVFVLAAIYLMDERRRGHIPRIAAGSIGAGLAANVIKLLVSRTRPRATDLAIESPLETFGQLFPFFSSRHSYHSFPSAHTSVAVGLAVCLSVYYPKGRPLFLLLAVLCGIHRLQSRAHFLSDVFFGAAVGLTTAAGCFLLPAASRFFSSVTLACGNRLAR